ncbi:MAG: cytochrome C [Casimicrobiaceae bacterium]
MSRFASCSVVVALAATFGCAVQAGDAAKPGHAAKDIDRGRYIVKIGGCNDCHTPGYAMSGGKVAEKDWLVGDRVGWRGPWGTTYPPNLRLYMQALSEAQWLKVAKTAQFRPPMPWWALHEMTEPDLRAVYHYIRHLGPSGSEAPPYVPPDAEPRPPYVQFPAPPK